MHIYVFGISRLQYRMIIYKYYVQCDCGLGKTVYSKNNEISTLWIPFQDTESIICRVHSVHLKDAYFQTNFMLVSHNKSTVSQTKEAFLQRNTHSVAPYLVWYFTLKSLNLWNDLFDFYSGEIQWWTMADEFDVEAMLEAPYKKEVCNIWISS